MTERANSDPKVVAAKQARLTELHVEPIVALANEIADSQGLPLGAVPYPDPGFGGVHARALVLLETPTVRSAARTGTTQSHRASALLSIENNDVTAANCHRAYRAAGLDPRWTLHWNVAPWPTPNETLAYVAEARPWLARLFDLLPDLKVVVTMGDIARDAWLRALGESSELPLLPTLHAPHSSARGLLHSGSYERLAAVFGRVAEIVQ
ncbi:MAG TPA: uracil-DNA glycosylase [Kribbella sp.]|jgi:hypothetical protein